MRFGKLVDGNIVNAPNPLMTDDGVVFSPTEATYLRNGWKRVHDEYPSEPAGDKKHWDADGWTETAEDITRKWKAVDDPVYPRKWTRLKMKTALATEGYLQQVKVMLGNIEIAPGYTALEAFTDCDYIEEFWPDEAKWGQMLDLAAATLGKTRPEIDAFLDTVPTDPGATV